MNDSSKRKREIKIEAIKTPEGQVPTVETFHKVIDGLFGEILDTRKDIAKLIPNLEKELDNLREILAQQMILFEIINNNVEKLENAFIDQAKNISKIQRAVDSPKESGSTEAELTEESKKAIAKVIKGELAIGTKPIYDQIKDLEKQITKSKSETLSAVKDSLDNIKDQLDDLSSKSELQMLEILESLNLEPSQSDSKSRSTSKTKRKLTS
ncbi:MAG: hypothetical protein EAX90_00180 [Candidatus Heimdallarchaeota archaeon]|nr:hypothetical protein [Candidatus Heimdallarchaeota archaeon]